MQVSQVSQAHTQYESMNLSPKKEQSLEMETVKQDLSLNARFAAYTFQSSEVSGSNASAQSALFDMSGNSQEMHDFLMGIEKEGMMSLSDMGYEGKPILELNPSEASALLSDGGFFSVENTAERGAGFVIAGAGNDLEMLQAGREGIIKGFEEAEKMWGGKLPDIAYDTQKLTLQKIDETIQSLGGNVLNIAA